MRARPGYLRLALAVLALIGQLTPVLALPVAAVANLTPRAACAATGSASCACSPVEQAAAACCCSEPKPPPEAPKPKKTSCCDALLESKAVTSCCEHPPEPKPAAKPQTTKSAAQIVAGGKCKCEKPAPAASAEPAAPHAHSDAVTIDTASAPHVGRETAIAVTGPLPPPAPPPRV